MTNPSDYKYVQSHEWLYYVDTDKVRVGITDFAQNAMGDIVFVNLPLVGDMTTAGEPLCDMESVKSVEDIFAPVSGEITAINEELMDHPELINSAPYEAWIAEISNITDTEELPDAAAYEAVCQEEE